MAVKQVRVSDLSGRQASEDEFAKLNVHEHPQYQGPITLDVLPDEIGKLPDSEQYVSIEVIQPGERSGQRALLSVERFNQLASSGDMPSVLMNAVAEQQPQRVQQSRRRGRTTKDGHITGSGRWSGACPTVGGSRPRKLPTSESTLTRSSGCGPSVECRYWIRPTPRPRSATAYKTFRS